MNCKSCGKEIDKKAVVCVHCGCKIKKPIFKKWWFWFLIFVVVVAIGSSAGNSGENDAATTNASSEQVEVKKNSPKISMEEFNALQTGMTYEEAVAIIGGEGELSSQVDVAGYDTKMYMWEGEGGFGANANATFQNNSLTSKAQFGLE